MALRKRTGVGRHAKRRTTFTADLSSVSETRAHTAKTVSMSRGRHSLSSGRRGTHSVSLGRDRHSIPLGPSFRTGHFAVRDAMVRCASRISRQTAAAMAFVLGVTLPGVAVAVMLSGGAGHAG